MRDPYDALGIEPGASIDEIRVAYRDLARQYHPDGFADAPPETRRVAHERMQEINHAFAVLTNTTERQRFERQRRLRERRGAADRSKSPTGGERNATPGEGVRFTTTPGSGPSPPEDEPNSSRSWRSEPPPEGFSVREFSGWNDEHWVFVYGPEGRAGKMNVTTGEVTVEQEDHREVVLRLLQHYAFDSWV